MRWRKMVACGLLMAMLLSFGCMFASAAKPANSPPDLSNASAVYFYHLESQQLMEAKNEAQRLPAGTSVRLLSGLILCEQLEGRMSEWVEIHEEMLRECKNSYRYGIEADPDTQGYELLEAAGKKRGFLLARGEIHTERMAKVLLDEYRGGKLGRFTLEEPEELENGDQ